MMTRTIVVLAAAAAGLAVAAYLVAVQLSIITHPWDPIFGTRQTLQVVTSSFSKSLPVPDAALGACGYAADVVLAVASTRDRTTSVVRVLYCAVAGAMAIGGLGLVVVQAAVVHHWCTLCLTSALLSWVVAAASIPGEVAVLRCLRRDGRRPEVGDRLTTETSMR